MTQLVDCNLLVTGATSTIGQAIARQAAAAGARLALHYHSNEAAAAALAKQLDALPVQADLSNPESIKGLINALDANGFHTQALVNNAADQSVGALDQLTLQQWQKMLRTNLDAVFYLTQQLAPAMLENALADRAPAVVNISSIEGTDPAAGHGHYATSKAAVNMLTKSLAAEYGPQGLRVNAVSPGLIHREGIEDAWPEGVANWRNNAPLGRLGEPEDVADAVVFLLSTAARWISGHNLVVDGGMTTQSRW